MARPPPSCSHDDDCLRLPAASPPGSNGAEKKEATAHRLNQPCPPCATPSSNSSLAYRRNGARIVENGFAAGRGVSKSAKVVLGRGGGRGLPPLGRERIFPQPHAGRVVERVGDRRRGRAHHLFAGAR